MKDKASVIQVTTSNAPPVEITILICACSRGQVSRPGDRQTRFGAYAECFRIGGWQDVGSGYRELSRGGHKGQDSQGAASLYERSGIH